MLSCWKFDDSHTAENISASILSHIQSWDVEGEISLCRKGQCIQYSG